MVLLVFKRLLLLWHKYNADILKIQYIWRKNLDNTLKKGVNLLHNIMKKITIAIDGFSSCGKSTMAKDLAREVGYIYIDSGAMYRAVTLYSIENGIFNGDVIDTEKLKKEIKRAEGMLSNERFISKAPEAKVQEEREKLEKYTQMLQQVQERMAGLKK